MLSIEREMDGQSAKTSSKSHLNNVFQQQSPSSSSRVYPANIITKPPHPFTWSLSLSISNTAAGRCGHGKFIRKNRRPLQKFAVNCFVRRFPVRCVRISSGGEGRGRWIRSELFNHHRCTGREGERSYKTRIIFILPANLR